MSGYRVFLKSNQKQITNIIGDATEAASYASRIRLDTSVMGIDGTQVRLSPGMTLAAEIKAGKRCVIEHFLSPLMAHGSESLRER